MLWDYTKPESPPIFGTQTLSQLIHAILFLPLDWPHQKAWTMLVISSQRLSGSLKTLIVYAGMACATALMRISLLACENTFSFHPNSLLSNLSFNARKVFFDLSTKEGRPRYVSCCFITSAPKHSFISA